MGTCQAVPSRFHDGKYAWSQLVLQHKKLLHKHEPLEHPLRARHAMPIFLRLKKWEHAMYYRSMHCALNALTSEQLHYSRLLP